MKKILLLLSIFTSCLFAARKVSFIQDWHDLYFFSSTFSNPSQDLARCVDISLLNISPGGMSQNIKIKGTAYPGMFLQHSNGPKNNFDFILETAGSSVPIIKPGPPVSLVVNEALSGSENSKHFEFCGYYKPNSTISVGAWHFRGSIAIEIEVLESSGAVVATGATRFEVGVGSALDISNNLTASKNVDERFSINGGRPF